MRAIYRPQNVYCIHVDSKADNATTYAVLDRLSQCFPNVFLASKRINVQWGYYSVLEADLVCLEDLVTKHRKWKYFINLTGQEFPLKTNWDIVKILTAYNGANDITGIPFLE